MNLQDHLSIAANLAIGPKGDHCTQVSLCSLNLHRFVFLLLGLSHWIVVVIAIVGSALLFGFAFIIVIIIYTTGICKKKPVNPDNNDPDNNTALQTEEIPSTNQALSITSPILPTSTEEKSDSSCRTEMAGTRSELYFSRLPLNSKSA